MRTHFLLTLLLSTLLLQTAQCVVEDSNENLVIALVADEFLKYATQDHYIKEGAQFFAQWCNSHGGFQYGNYTRTVEVISEDASASNPANTPTFVKNAYTRMTNRSTLVLSPISTPRTNAAINISETQQQINLVVGASADAIFKSGYKNVFSTVVPTSQIPQYSLAQFVGKAKSYVLYSTNDAVSISVTSSVLTYMNKSNIPLVYTAQLAINTTDNAGLEASIKEFLNLHLTNVTADLVVCTFPPDDFSLFVSAFEALKPNTSAAAFVLPLTRTVQQTNKQGRAGDYWVGATQYDPTNPFGVSGEYGGTAHEFYEAFNAYFKHDPDPYSATAAAALMSYYNAVKYAGTVNTAAVRQAMVDMPIFNSFLGDIKFFPNGTSKYAIYETFQFMNGVGEFINGSHQVIYPAPWSWNPVPEQIPYSRFSKGLSIALGVVTGICVCVAIVALFLLVAKREAFRKQGVVYCGIIVLGVLLAYAAALTTLPERTDRLCLAFPWLLGIGFTLVFGCLFIKTWVLFLIFRSVERLQKTLFVTPAYIMRLIAAAVITEVVFLIVWTEVDPPKAEYKMTVDNKLQLMCTRTHSAFWAVFIAYKGVWLLGGVVVSILTRDIRADYNESKNIVLSIYNCTVVTVIAVILAFILHKVPAAIVLIQVIAIVVAFTFTLVVLFSTPFTNMVKSPSTSSLDAYRSQGDSTTAASRTSAATKNSGSHSGNSAGAVNSSTQA